MPSGSTVVRLVSSPARAIARVRGVVAWVSVALASSPHALTAQRAPTAAATAPSAQCAKGPVTVPATARILLDDRLTMAEARAEAMRQAMAEAVRTVVGTRIDASQQRVASEAGKGTLTDSYVSIVSGTARGRVVDTKDIVYKVEPEGRVNFLAASLSAVVVCEQGEPDYTFKLTVTTDRPSYLVRADGSADAVIATITSTKNAYLSLFWVTQDSVQLVWPNEHDPDARLMAGVARMVPPARLQKTLKLEPELPPGRTREVDYFLAVATSKPITFDGTKSAASARDAETVWGNLHALNRWLASIPVGSRAIATASFRIESTASDVPPSGER